MEIKEKRSKIEQAKMQNRYKDFIKFKCLDAHRQSNYSQYGKILNPIFKNYVQKYVSNGFYA